MAGDADRLKCWAAYSDRFDGDARLARRQRPRPRRQPRRPARRSHRGQPADHDHRFGHGKAEALVSLVQVILITISAIFIGFRAVQRLLSGAETGQCELGIGVSLSRSSLTFALIAYQRHVVAAHRIARDRDRPTPLFVRPDAQRLGDRRAGARSVCADLSGADAVFGIADRACGSPGARVGRRVTRSTS